MARALTAMEKELAIMRGIAFLKQFQIEEGGSYTNDQLAIYLRSLILQIHKELFQDSYNYKSDDVLQDRNRPGIEQADGINLQLQKVLHDLCKRFFVTGSSPVESSRFPEIFAEYYLRLIEIEPFAYGNELVLGMFFTILTKFAKEPHTYIDFRRLTPTDKSPLSVSTILENIRFKGRPVTTAILATVFAEALSNSRNIAPPREEVEIWNAIDSHEIELGLQRFLFVMRNGKTYLLTRNGGAVALNEPYPEFGGRDLEQHINDHTLNGLPVEGIKIPTSRIEWYINEELRETSVSGSDTVSLFCLSTNIYTKLTAEYHSRLLGFLGRQGMNLSDLMDDAKVERLRGTLTPRQDNFLEILEIAVESYRKTEAIIAHAVDNIFEGKTPVGNGNNSVVITMGGAGSGKTVAGKKIITGKAGENFVIASLDDARSSFSEHNLMIAAKHHADYYTFIEQAALEIRRRVAERAIKEGYHLLYDTTGIPWQNRYAEMVDGWRKQVGTITVSAVDCMLYVDEPRRKEFPESAIERVEERFIREGRIVPYQEVAERHINFSRTCLDAFVDPNVDEFAIIDNAGPEGSAYILAQKYTVDRTTLEELNLAKEQARLYEMLKEKNMLPADKTHVDILIRRGRENDYFILVITDRERFVDMLRKSQMNKDAVGYEALPFTTNNMGWVIGATSRVDVSKVTGLGLAA